MFILWCRHCGVFSVTSFFTISVFSLCSMRRLVLITGSKTMPHWERAVVLGAVGHRAHVWGCSVELWHGAPCGQERQLCWVGSRLTRWTALQCLLWVIQTWENENPGLWGLPMDSEKKGGTKKPLGEIQRDYTGRKGKEKTLISGRYELPFLRAITRWNVPPFPKCQL